MALIKCPECKKKISDQCEKCPNCGYPINKIYDAAENQATDIENIDEGSAKGKKSFNIKSLLKKWWFWVAIGVVIVAITATTILLLNRDTKPRFDKDGNPIFVELTNEVYTNAEDYLGYHINIKGKVFQTMSDNGSVKGIQVWLDPDTCEQNMMIYYDTDVEAKQGDYIMCSGYIDSVTEYKNVYDAKLYAPVVISSDLAKATYIDVMSPTTATITPENLKQEKHGYSISIDKIEFAKKETRVYATIENNGKALLYIDDAVIVQNTKQYNSTDNYEANYDKIPYKIVRGVSSSGIIVFPAVTTNDFELTINVYSDDYDEKIDKFTFKISKEKIVIEKPKENQPTTSPPNNKPTTTTNKNQQAVAAAKEIVDFYASPFPAMVKQILMDDYGYTETQANYALQNVSVDWNFYVVGHLEEYFLMNDGNVTKGDAERYLYVEKGYSDSAIEYAFANADIDWESSPPQNTPTSSCSGHHFNPPTCTTPSKCIYCGLAEGKPVDCQYINGSCHFCGKKEPWTPPIINCSSWVSLKELEQKTEYTVRRENGKITIAEERVSFVLDGFHGGETGVVYELDCNGAVVHFKWDSDSNEVDAMIKLKYSDLVTIGVLA